MDFCRSGNVRSGSPKNIITDNHTMTEVDVLSGFNMDDEPAITIENNSERPIISLDNDIGDMTDGVNIIGRLSEPTTQKKIQKPPTPPKRSKNIEKIQKLDSFVSNDSSGGSSGGSVLEYKRDDISKESVPFDFGDIADQSKHKPVEEVKYDDNGYSSAGGTSDGSYYDKQDTYNQPQSYNHKPHSSYDDRPQQYDRESEGDRYRREDEEKQDILIKLQALESKGNIRLSREFSMKSRLDDIKFEYEKQKTLIEKDASVEFMKSMLITVVHGTEIINNKWDPVGAKLNGWSESVMENLGSYEAIFERLHEKYTGSVDIAPEMELLANLASSAFMFHMMQTLFKSAAPNMGAAMRQDPNLMAGLGQAAARAADMSSGGRGVPTPSNQANMGGPSGGFDIASLLSGLGPMMGGMGQQQRQTPNVAQAFQNPPPRPINPRNEPTVSEFGQQNFNRPRDDDENSRITDYSDGSNGSGVRVTSNKKGNRTIHLL